MANSIQRSKGTVSFRPKLSKVKMAEVKNEDSLLFIHYSYGRNKRFKYSTGYEANYNNWDFIKQEYKNKADVLNRAELNLYFTNMKLALEKAVVKFDSEQYVYNNSDLKKVLNFFTKKDEKRDDDKQTLLNYFPLFIEFQKNKVSPGTITTYKQTEKRLIEFNNKRRRIDFALIDMVFYYEFILFLEEVYKYRPNTIGKHIKNLCSIMNQSLDIGLHTNIKFQSKDFKAPNETTFQIYLTTEEIERIIGLDLSYNKTRERARDIFIIGYTIGQRVSDYNGIDKDCIIENKGRKFFKIKQEKTKKEVHCYINPIAQKIMNKRYDGFPPPKLSEQHINKHLKIIGEDAKINNIEDYMVTIGGEEIKISKEKYKLIGTHTARRSFCTNMYKNKMHPYDIMHFSGHTTEKEFYKYIRVKGLEKATNIVDRNISIFNQLFS